MTVRGIGMQLAIDVMRILRRNITGGYNHYGIACRRLGMPELTVPGKRFGGLANGSAQVNIIFHW